MFRGLTLLAAHEAASVVRQRAISIAFYAGAALVAAIAAVYALNALHDWLSPQVSPILASLMIAGGLLVVSLLLAIAGWVQRNRRPKTSAATSAALLAAPLAARGIGKLNAGTVLALCAVAAGAIAGRKLAKG